MGEAAEQTSGGPRSSRCVTERRPPHGGRGLRNAAPKVRLLVEQVQWHDSVEMKGDGGEGQWQAAVRLRGRLTAAEAR